MIPAASIPGTRPSTASSWASSSRISGVVKFAQLQRPEHGPFAAWAGESAATTARHARAVALTRSFGDGANGIP